MFYSVIQLVFTSFSLYVLSKAFLMCSYYSFLEVICVA